MQFRSGFVFSMIACSILLTSCAPFKPTDHRAAICNELNSKMVFNGSTSNTRESEIQNSEQQLLWRSYEKNNCDQQ